MFNWSEFGFGMDMKKYRGYYKKNLNSQICNNLAVRCFRAFEKMEEELIKDQYRSDEDKVNPYVHYKRKDSLRSLCGSQNTTDLPDTDAMNKLIVETINKVIIDVYAMLAETELQRKTKRQQEGLIAMKERGEWDNYGRHRVMSLPDFEKEYQNVKDGKIKSLELMRKLNMKKSTYFKYVREIKLMNSTD